MAKCIDEVHADLGLRCGAALTTTPTVKALPMAQVDMHVQQMPTMATNESGQLDLLAA